MVSVLKLVEVVMVQLTDPVIMGLEQQQQQEVVMVQFTDPVIMGLVQQQLEVVMEAQPDAAKMDLGQLLVDDVSNNHKCRNYY